MTRRYRDAEFLREQYVNRRKSSRDIADMCDTSSSTVSRWLDRHDIDREPRYKNCEWLTVQYVEKRRSQQDIADECNVAKTTICHWLSRLEITDGESMETGECVVCGDSFRYYPSVRDGRFCSNECSNALRKRQVEVTCPNCGETFERRQSLDAKYCSIECWADEYGVGVSTLYRSGWQTKRKEALQRDNYQCTVCGITNQEHEERFGFGLDVHHMVPLRLFAKWDKPIEDAHSLRNLTTVCRTHHPDSPGATVENE